MSEPNRIDQRSNRNFIFGLGFFAGLLSLSFIESVIQMSLFKGAATLLGLAAIALLYRWLESDIPRGVDTIASQAADLQEDKRMALRDFLRDDDRHDN